MTRLRCLLTSTALLLAVGAVPAQTWLQLSPTTVPTARRTGAIAFHPVQNGLVTYGGLQTGNVLLNDTMVWSGSDWTVLTTATTPPPRWGHRMVYDSHRGRIVTFGGRSPTITATANDTWEFDGVDWHQVVTPTSPNARAFYSMAFDERRGKTVLFGVQSGVVAAGGNQTWEYDGTTWIQVMTATTPPGLETPAMAYDKGRGVIVMFSGWNGTSPGQFYNTTYEYDGVDWALRTPAASPPSRYRAGCSYDDARGRVVVYGGYGGTALQDTWEYDGNTWTQVAASGPARSTEGYMDYDAASQLTVYFGGSGPTGISNETWIYTAVTTAIAAPFGTGCATSAGVPSLTPTTTPVLGTPYTQTLTGAPASTLAVVVHGLDNLQFAPGLYLPLDLTVAGIGGCGLEVRPDLLLTELVAGGSMSHTLAFPNNLALTGEKLFTQVFVFDLGAPNGFGGMSNAVHAVLGS